MILYFFTSFAQSYSDLDSIQQELSTPDGEQGFKDMWQAKVHHHGVLNIVGDIAGLQQEMTHAGALGVSFSAIFVSLYPTLWFSFKSLTTGYSS